MKGQERFRRLMRKHGGIKECQLTVSSSHFCLRASFFQIETKLITKGLLHILKSDIYLHIDDFDILNFEFIAVCVDLFIDVFRKSDKTTKNGVDSLVASRSGDKTTLRGICRSRQL